VGTEQEFDDDADDLPRRRFVAGAIGVAVAAILVAATVTEGDKTLQLEGEEQSIEGYSGGVTVTWGRANYDPVVGEFVIYELTVRPASRSAPFPADHSLHVVLVDVGRRVLGESIVAADGRSPLRIELPRAVSVRSLGRIILALERDPS
jgi:hypothetical protein